MFRPLNHFKDVPCPALLEKQPCTIPRCIFSHQIATAAPATPSVADAIPPISSIPPATPFAAPTPPPPASESDEATKAKLRAIVAGTHRTTDGEPAKRRKIDTAADAKSAIPSAGAPRQKVAEPASATPKTTASYSSVLKDSIKKTTPATATPAKPPLKRTASPTNPVSPPVQKKVARQHVRKIDPNSAAAAALTKPAPSAKPAAASTPVQPLQLTPRVIARAPAQHGIRYKYIVKLHEELTRLHKAPSDQTTKNMIIKKTLDVEEEIATTKRSIYTSAMGRYIMRLTKLTPEAYAAELAAEAAKNAPAPPATTNKNHEPPIKTGLTAKEEILHLRQMVHTPEVLRQYEYTLTPPTDAEIATAKDGLKAANNYEQCDRCRQRFQVFPGRDPTGRLTSSGPCVHHPGRALRRPHGESEWSCCRRTVGGFDQGCQTSQHHVYYVSDPKRLATSFQYITTPANPAVTEPRAIAFDCEMCYTTLGMEVCRLTAVSFPAGDVVIDALVRPFGEVLDFNSKFSGVTAEMFSRAPPYTAAPYPEPDAARPYVNPTQPLVSAALPILPSPEAARKALLEFVSPETVLVGHALNNDLTVLRLCHEKVVDTVVLFPHTRGFPARNRLKFIVQRWLGRDIQVDGDESGHDSAVDARCAAELCRVRIKERKELGHKV